MNTPICCTECERPLNVPPELAGRVVKCPNCGNLLSVAAKEALAPDFTTGSASSLSATDTPPPTLVLPRPGGEVSAGRAWAVILGLAALPLAVLMVGVGAWLLFRPTPPVAALPTAPSNGEPALVPPTAGIAPHPPTTRAAETPPTPGLPAPIRPVTLEGPGVSPDWKVIFRSAHPAIWNTDVRDDEQHFAVPVKNAPADLKYVRVRHDREFVILAVTRDQLTQAAFTGDCGWSGENRLAFGGYHLGVIQKSPRPRDQIAVSVAGPDIFSPYDGWGFGHRSPDRDGQGFSWGTTPLAPAVLEIAVKSGDLTDVERKRLIVSTVRIEPIDPPELAGAGVSPDWTVLLCSADPAVWNSDVTRDANHRARPATQAPEDTRYLRLRKGAEYVILPVKKADLTRLVDQGAYGWQGTAVDNSHALHLGIFSRKMALDPRGDRGATSVRFLPFRSGWGFGHKHWLNDGQGYCWDGKTIPPTVFEIAVKPGDLTAEEEKHVLRE